MDVFKKYSGKLLTLGKADAKQVGHPPNTDKDKKAFRYRLSVRELVQNKKTSILEIKPAIHSQQFEMDTD